jgi:hypothetical protein
MSFCDRSNTAATQPCYRMTYGCSTGVDSVVFNVCISLTIDPMTAHGSLDPINKIFILKLNNKHSKTCSTLDGSDLMPCNEIVFNWLLMWIQTWDGVGLGLVVREVRQHPEDHEFESQRWQWINIRVHTRMVNTGWCIPKPCEQSQLLSPSLKQYESVCIRGWWIPVGAYQNLIRVCVHTRMVNTGWCIPKPREQSQAAY